MSRETSRAEKDDQDDDNAHLMMNSELRNRTTGSKRDGATCVLL